MELEQVELLGADWVTFILFSCGMMGFLAFMSGAALAKTWRPLWQTVPYAVLLGVAQRFLVFALFLGDLWSLSGYLIGTAVLLVVAVAAYYLTLTRQMVAQYPWLHERTGPFTWQRKPQP